MTGIAPRCVGWVSSLLLALPCCTVAPPAAAQVRAIGPELPASYLGVLPCSDCDGVRAQLDLWPDGVFHLQRTYVGKSGRDDDRGRWRRDPIRPVLFLYSGREMPLQLEIVGPRTLRPLDLHGKPVGSGNAHDLVTDGALTTAELRLGLHGMFRYLADAARFEECLTGRSYPVAMEGDFVALQRAYQSARAEPGAAMMASFDGRIEPSPSMEGSRPVPTVIVDRFIGVWPGQRCERAMSRASLADTYWRIVHLQGRPVEVASGQRQPHLLIHSEPRQYAADAGCGRFNGSHSVEGDRIRFGAPAAMPATCTPWLVAQQRTLVDALAAARTWSIQAQALELFDSGGNPVALLEAVYLR